MEVLGKGFSFLNTQFWIKDRGRYFVIKTIDFVLEIPQIEYYCLIALFSTKYGMFAVFFLIEIFNNQEKYKLLQ